MLVHKCRESITASSGTGSANTLKFSGGLLNQIYSKATTSTNIYDLDLIDEDNEIIYSQEAVEGDFQEHSVEIPLRGIYTIRITSATIDESIVVKLMIQE